jgi:alkanesulfonate monooxygenase SsuD/methylene tetrahydromethanopterin reductase-like flavin-dependent oxidoreductase (luciferase family)
VVRAGGDVEQTAERRIDGRVACRHGHWRDRPRVYVPGSPVVIDPAAPGADTNVEQHTISVTVAFIKRAGDPTCQMRVTVPGASGEPVAMAVNMSEYPTDEERKALVAGIATAARTGINNIDFKIRNPVVADIVDRYGADAPVPKALTDYIKGRQGYDYNQHGRAGNTHADFVPDEIVDRFCILGGVEHHLARLKELKELGVDQFAIYLQHDGKDRTLEAYGESILPAMLELGKAKQ